jgi:hypothetical protein
MRSIAAQEGTQVDVEAIVEMMPILGTRSRTALSILAKATIVERRLTIGELAKTMQLPEYETVGIVQELMELVWKRFGPTMSVVRTAPLKPKAGAIDWHERQVVVWTALAVAVVAAEAQLADGA